MPFAIRDGIRIYWKRDGARHRPTLVLLNSIGTDMSLWDHALPYLLPAFNLLRMDTRGHGASDAPDRDYSLAELAADVLAVMDAAGIERAAVAGLSLGGMVAMELTLAAPQRVSSLVLVCTSAAMDSTIWVDRISKVRSGGLQTVIEAVMARFFAPDFAKSHPEIVESVRANLLAMTPAGYAGAGAAIRDMALIERLPAIGVPTLVISGDRDVSTPFANHGARIAAAIPGAKTAQIETAHLAPFEAPGALAAAMRAFLLDSKAVEAADVLFEAGLVHRKRILGEAWVKKSLDGRTSFTADFQAMITRIAWAEIWSRPGLEDRTRRLLVISMTAALGRWEEFRLHVRAGLEGGGFTRDELKEVLLQTAIYAGVPAANTAFAEASEVMSALDGAKTKAP